MTQCSHKPESRIVIVAERRWMQYTIGTLEGGGEWQIGSWCQQRQVWQTQRRRLLSAEHKTENRKQKMTRQKTCRGGPGAWGLGRSGWREAENGPTSDKQSLNPSVLSPQTAQGAGSWELEGNWGLQIPLQLSLQQPTTYPDTYYILFLKCYLMCCVINVCCSTYHWPTTSSSINRHQ